MKKRPTQPSEKQGNNKRSSEQYNTELNRMDYEGGNQGKEASNKRKTEKEDRDTDEPRPKSPGNNRP